MPPRLFIARKFPTSSAFFFSAQHLTPMPVPIPLHTPLPSDPMAMPGDILRAQAHTQPPSDGRTKEVEEQQLELAELESERANTAHADPLDKLAAFEQSMAELSTLLSQTLGDKMKLDTVASQLRKQSALELDTLMRSTLGENAKLDATVAQLVNELAEMQAQLLEELDGQDSQAIDDDLDTALSSENLERTRQPPSGPFPSRVERREPAVIESERAAAQLADSHAMPVDSLEELPLKDARLKTELLLRNAQLEKRLAELELENAKLQESAAQSERANTALIDSMQESLDEASEQSEHDEALMDMLEVQIEKLQAEHKELVAENAQLRATAVQSELDAQARLDATKATMLKTANAKFAEFEQGQGMLLAKFQKMAEQSDGVSSTLNALEAHYAKALNSHKAESETALKVQRLEYEAALNAQKAKHDAASKAQKAHWKQRLAQTEAQHAADLFQSSRVTENKVRVAGANFSASVMREACARWFDVSQLGWFRIQGFEAGKAIQESILWKQVGQPGPDFAISRAGWTAWHLQCPVDPRVLPVPL
ncbi:hypothetical protein FB567DRAFT_547030 [Paraphoma chrysanthemicola]|uniref:Uncharacterized protein n=1 Tax=Paraphoma chrysanthemicola TaxID=798071 RepID=A0A8K0R7G1_9PLEO|nr:hypothetical protein FB567DRAFT_547030 [Paraphoma chrysanthemicola]